MEIIFIYLIAFIAGYMIFQLLYTKNNFRVGGQLNIDTPKYKEIFKKAYKDYETNTKKIIKDIKGSYHEDYCEKSDEGIHYNMCNILSDVASEEILKKLQSTKTSVCNIKNSVTPKKLTALCGKIGKLVTLEKSIENFVNTKTLKDIHKTLTELKNKYTETSSDYMAVQSIENSFDDISDALKTVLEFKTTINNLKTISDTLICGKNSKYQSQYTSINKMCNIPVKEIDVSNIKTECRELLNDKDFKNDYINCDKI